MLFEDALLVAVEEQEEQQKQENIFRYFRIKTRLFRVKKTNEVKHHFVLTKIISKTNLPSTRGALRSLVTAFLSRAPPLMSDKRALLSTPFEEGDGPFDPKDGGGGGAGGGGGGIILEKTIQV